jgi:hypothetical protein
MAERAYGRRTLSSTGWTYGALDMAENSAGATSPVSPLNPFRDHTVAASSHADRAVTYGFSVDLRGIEPLTSCLPSKRSTI